MKRKPPSLEQPAATRHWSSGRRPIGLETMQHTIEHENQVMPSIVVQPHHTPRRGFRDELGRTSLPIRLSARVDSSVSRPPGSVILIDDSDPW